MSKSNVEKLQDAGALDTKDMDNEHLRILNEEFDDNEIDVIIKLKNKINPNGFKPDTSGAGF